MEGRMEVAGLREVDSVEYLQVVECRMEGRMEMAGLREVDSVEYL
jgi:hypothetical protein